MILPWFYHGSRWIPLGFPGCQVFQATEGRIDGQRGVHLGLQLVGFLVPPRLKCGDYIVYMRYKWHVYEIGTSISGIMDRDIESYIYSVCVCMYVCVYIERERDVYKCISMYNYVYMYIYIYMCTYMIGAKPTKTLVKMGMNCNTNWRWTFQVLGPPKWWTTHKWWLESLSGLQYDLVSPCHKSLG